MLTWRWISASWQKWPYLVILLRRIVLIVRRFFKPNKLQEFCILGGQVKCLPAHSLLLQSYLYRQNHKVFCLFRQVDFLLPLSVVNFPSVPAANSLPAWNRSAIHTLTESFNEQRTGPSRQVLSFQVLSRQYVALRAFSLTGKWKAAANLHSCLLSLIQPSQSTWEH